MKNRFLKTFIFSILLITTLSLGMASAWEIPGGWDNFNRALRVIPDGTSTAPAWAFKSEPTLGFYRSGSGAISLTGGTLSMLGGTYILSDADVVHGMTTVTATTNYGLLSAISGTDGGLSIQGLSDTDAIPLYIRGVIGSTNPTDTLEAISLVGAKKNGTGVQALGSSETVLQILNNTTELFTQTGDGSYRQPASTYHNFGATIGTGGYGIYDNAGTLQFKNSGGAWADLVSAVSAGGWQDDGTIVRLITGTDKVGIGTAEPTALLDVAPSTTNSSIRVGSLELQSYAVNNAWLMDNAYFDGSNVKYRSNGYATQLLSSNGDIFFRTAPSGTAGNSATLTEQVTIKNTGNTGIGTTSPSYTVDSAGAINSRVYYAVEEFDEEVTTTQFESGKRASEWVTAGTNYAAANVTYTVGPGGTLKVLCANADNDSVTSLGVLNYNTTNNPVMEVRVKIDTKETAAFYVGFASAAFADANGAFPADAFLVGINSDNGHTFGATQIIAASVDNGAAVDYDDMGVVIVSDTYVKIKIDLTDTEQPRVWINDTEIAAGNITGTVQAGIALAPYFMVQNLAGGAIQRFVTLDYFKMWQDR